LKQYYSIRTGKNNQGINFDLSTMIKLFHDLFIKLRGESYFDEHFGFTCTDGYINGKIGEHIEAFIFRKIRKENLWTISKYYKDYTEDDLFDIIEFLFDYISKPTEGWNHTWNDCGMHWEKFDQVEGRIMFRKEINELLIDYSSGFELSENGEILNLPEKGFEKLLKAPIPKHDEKNITKRIEFAVNKFRRFKSSENDRKDALRELADILEFLRPQLKKVLKTTDENDLFNIINNFGIRHHNNKQKLDYDKPIWYSWMFYYYLATIHAVLRIIEKV
jgi:hypothetical protein